ncbi:MAG: MBL fold metallo-hydrolase [Sphingobacterium sp.]|nr:MBL fold metallo-hydrolase [Sphingobacterium sp.]
MNTHWHSDHTDGNKAFGPGATIIAHENVRAVLARDEPLMGGITKALPEDARPNVTFKDGLTFYAGGQAIRLVHFPDAHTDGDTVVFLDGGRVVHMGDMFFNGMFPFMDVAHGGDIESWIKHLDHDPGRPARGREDHPRARPASEGRPSSRPSATCWRPPGVLRREGDEGGEDARGDQGRRPARRARAVGQRLHEWPPVARARLPEPGKERGPVKRHRRPDLHRFFTFS